jgi:hypothetical protein
MARSKELGSGPYIGIIHAGVDDDVEQGDNTVALPYRHPRKLECLAGLGLAFRLARSWLGRVGGKQGG